MTQTSSWTDSDDFDPDAFKGPPPFEKSIYAFEIEKAELAKTKKGDPSISLTLKLTSDLVREKGANKTLNYQNIVVSEGSAWKLAQFVKSVQYNLTSKSREALQEMVDSLPGYSGHALCAVGRPNNKGKSYPEAARFLKEDEIEDAVAKLREELGDEELEGRN